MTVSVIIPAHNEEKYIKMCLDALTQQEEKADEIIIVDNNCADKTAHIAKQYPIKIIHEKKQGMVFARNAGFDNATSDIIARCDADVIVPKDWIKKIKMNFLAPQIDALTGPAYFYDMFIAGRTILPFLLYHYVLRIILGHHILTGPNMIITRKMWEKIRSEVCKNDALVHEDIDLSLHVKKYGYIKFDPNLVVRVSARRIKHNPFSFFIEYPSRLIQTLNMHQV